jgi:DNA-binding transcriptional ArsR family regulator
MVNHSLDQTFSALADPIRRSVVTRLAAGEESVSALADGHPISLPAFLKHVRVLERAGLVRTVKRGRVRRCRLDAARLREAEGWLQEHRLFWERQLHSLERFLRQHPDPEHPR